MVGSKQTDSYRQ